MVSSGKKGYKYFIGCKNDDYKIKQLSIIFPQTSAYVKSYDDETKWVHLLTEDGEFFQKYTKVWDKVSNNIKIKFDSEPPTSV